MSLPNGQHPRRRDLGDVVQYPPTTAGARHPSIRRITASGNGRRALLVGDFNVGDRHYLYRRLRAGLGDAHRDAGWGLGLTWSLQNRVPFARIDYVLHDESWGTRSISRQAIPGSDHRALVAELVLD
jgi:endonuclease/exonuclease/phosphatase (EEP) superfamily protein YafD